MSHDDSDDMMSHVNRQTEGSTSNLVGQHSQQSDAAASSNEARQRRRIAQLEEKLEALESGRAIKERYASDLYCM
jgi:hypothetical protein